MKKKFVLEFDSQEEMDAFIDKASLTDKNLDDIMWDRMSGLYQHRADVRSLLARFETVYQNICSDYHGNLDRTLK